jgi:uncharacterized membrane protein YdfJ with MMPL/SSD domain
MLGALADLALKRPWGLLAANVAVAAAAVVASLGAPSELGIGSTRLEGSGDSDLVVVLRGDVAADTRVFEVAEDVITAQVETDPAVASVAPQRTGGSDDAGRVVLVGEFEDVSQAERQEAVERLEEGIDPGPLRVEIGGETAVLTEARRSLGGDLWRVELLVLPLVLLAMAAAIRPRLVGAPVLATVTAVAGTLALMRLAGTVVDVSLLGIAAGAVVGVVLGIELPAMVADLRRDEAALSPEPRALHHAVGEGALRTALIAGAASLPALALLLTPLDQAASLALGCALAAWLAAASALTGTPALLRLLETEATVETGVEAADAEEAHELRWLRQLLGAVAETPWRTVAALAIGLAPLVALGAAAADGLSTPLAATDLPRGSEARTATEAVAGAVNGAGSLFSDLPLVAAVAGALLGVGALAWTRRPGSLLAVPAGLLPAAGALGACVLVFQDGHLASALDVTARDALDTGAVAALVCALAAVGAARSAAALAAIRAERRLGVAPAGAAEFAGAFTMPAVTAATVAGAAMAGALVAPDLYVAKEFGFAVAVGLVLDLLLVRVALLAALARWSG